MTIEQNSFGWWIATDIVNNQLITARADTKSGAKQMLRHLIKKEKTTHGK